ncbi:DNA internalization-related competence protein ComEC/Rec2 [Thermoanaerobacterium sp. RBIITD]|uniref:DNA internalization-related competence protein ComEC/Rec2 n=1 Tax=Thermoanaerobacterium sp. RBIITD TaxID=1550240 RepID=UPI000BB9B9E7|nr:DNA internalization-related competence protein ComEC/Rec2 [Thermoanaerobacterium sp. RBIITD]SNX55223.1 competence protein ComEC [Thermoanaerobacterium sp. RBIITD]
MNIPFLYIAIALSLGIILSKYVEINIIVSSVTLILTLIVSIYRHLKGKDITTLLLLCIAIFGIINGTNVTYSKGMYDKLNDKLVSFKGIISNVENKDRLYKYVLKPENMNKILVTQIGGISPKDGDLVEIRGIVKIPQGRRNPGGFDYKLYLKKYGIDALMSVNSYSVSILKKSADSPINKFFRDMREKIKANYNKSMPQKDAEFVSSVILGENDVDEDTLSSFRVTGISHIIAVSGYNFGLLTVFMVFILGIFHIKRYSTPIVIPILILYTLLTGSPPSAVRSAIMACMALIAVTIGRYNYPLNSISFAAVLILIINPLMLYDIGFQLSFAATLAILCLYKPIKEKLKLKNEIIRDAISLTVAAQLGTLPITIYVFHNISIISLVPNLIIVPIVSVTVIIGFLSAFFGLIMPYLAFLLNIINTPIVEIVLYLTKFFANVPYASINVPIPSFYIIIFYYLVLVVSLSSFDRSKKIIISSSILALLIIIMAINAILPKDVEVTFLDVGQGDSTFLRTQHGKKILIDGGGRPLFNGETSFDVGQNILLPYLFYENASSLDAIFISHTDSDHIGGILSILNDIDVDRIFIGHQVQKDDNYKKLISLASMKKIPVYELTEGDTVTIDKVCFKVLSPGKTVIQENPINNNALVFKMSYKDVDFLFTGDIEKEAEDALKNLNISSDILKVAHHGSSTSSQKEFIEKVNPKICVIQVGKNNYGQPDDNIVKYLKSISSVYRTDNDGAIIIDTNGTYIHVKKMIGK